MGQVSWNTIINSKFFYVRTYRLAGTSLIVSLLINLLLGSAIYYFYFHQPRRNFYASSGIVPPIKLTPLEEPNNSSTYLLPSDPVDDNTVKVIPD